eukprot:scaffold1881_cov256-Pinguiococcus_pyrenoidosus.AAC.10
MMLNDVAEALEVPQHGRGLLRLESEDHHPVLQRWQRIRRAGERPLEPRSVPASEYPTASAARGEFDLPRHEFWAHSQECPCETLASMVRSYRQHSGETQPAAYRLQSSSPTCRGFSPSPAAGPWRPSSVERARKPVDLAYQARHQCAYFAARSSCESFGRKVSSSPESGPVSAPVVTRAQ